jgi:dihydroorotate dehydrogenase (fumarate)
MEITAASVFSTASERRNVLRWIAMASAQDIKIDISASTGVHSAEDAIRYILAGANSVQVCSVLYQKGMPWLKTMNHNLKEWMAEKHFKNIDDFRGKLNWLNYDNPAVFERTQFIKYFSSVD